MSRRRAALIAAWGYLAIFVLAIFANFGVRERLVDQDDPGATVGNIAGSESLFRLALGAFLVVFLLDVVIAWVLHMFFRGARPDLSIVTAWFRVIHAVLMGAALVFFFLAIEVATGAVALSGQDAGARGAQVDFLLDAFDFMWLIGLAAFGVHLLLLGLLVLRSALAPPILGALLACAGAAYLVDTFAHALLTDYARYEDVLLGIVVVTSVAGEFAFAMWLLVRGGRASRGRGAGAGIAAAT